MSGGRKTLDIDFLTLRKIRPLVPSTNIAPAANYVLSVNGAGEGVWVNTISNIYAYGVPIGAGNTGPTGPVGPAGNITPGSTGYGNLVVYQNTGPTGTIAYANSITVDSAGHLLPTTPNAYDLGSTGAPWRDLYVSTGTIYMGSASQIRGDNNGNVLTSGIVAGSGEFTSRTLTGSEALNPFNQNTYETNILTPPSPSLYNIYLLNVTIQVMRKEVEQEASVGISILDVGSSPIPSIPAKTLLVGNYNSSPTFTVIYPISVMFILKKTDIENGFRIRAQSLAESPALDIVYTFYYDMVGLA
jgi:hypothetical protein